jgi:hypothetical protein
MRSTARPGPTRWRLPGVTPLLLLAATVVPGGRTPALSTAPEERVTDTIPAHVLRQIKDEIDG